MANQTQLISKAVNTVEFKFERRTQSTEIYSCINKEDGSYYDIEILKHSCNDYEDGLTRVTLQAQKRCSNHIGDAGDELSYKVYSHYEFNEKLFYRHFQCAYHSYLQNKSYADKWLEWRNNQ